LKYVPETGISKYFNLSETLDKLERFYPYERTVKATVHEYKNWEASKL